MAVVLPGAVTPATGSLAAADFPLDIERMRTLCARSSAQNPDAEFRAILGEAIDDTEQVSGLKIRSGTFVARYPVTARATPATRASTGREARGIDRYDTLALPGIACETVSVLVDAAGDPALPTGLRSSDRAGNLFIDPPDAGWDFAALAGGKRLDRLSVVVSFRAGGRAGLPVPGAVQKAIGLRALWHLNQEPEDEEQALRQLAMYAFRRDW